MAAIISFTYDKALAKLCSKWKCVNNCEQFKQSAQALELLHERKMWNEQKNVLSERSEFAFFANAFPHLE